MNDAVAAPSPPGAAVDEPLRYQVSRWDLARLAWVHPVWSPWLLFPVLLTRLWVNVMRLVYKPLLALLGSVSVALGVKADSVPLIALGIVLLLLLPTGFAKLLVMRGLARHYAPRGLAARCTLEVTPDALVWRCDDRERQIPWRMVKTIHNLPHALLLHAPHFGDVLLPKRIFPDRDSLRAFLAVAAARSGRIVQPYTNPLRGMGFSRSHWLAWLVLGLVIAAMVGVTALVVSNDVR